MLEVAEDLGQTAVLVGAVVPGLAFGTDKGGAAHGAHSGILHRRGTGGTFVEVHAHNLGDDFSALLHQQAVAVVDA